MDEPGLTEILYQVTHFGPNGSTTTLDENLTRILDDFSSSLFVYHKLSNAILIGIYIPLFLVALCSNLIVILVVRRFKSLRNVTLICMPTNVLKAIYSLWLYGSFLCKITHYLTGVAVASSIFTISVMSLERLLSIRYPMSRTLLVTKKSVRKIIVLLWLISLLIFCPILYIRKPEGIRVNNREFLFCIEAWPNANLKRAFGVTSFILVFAIPGLIIIIAYSLMGLKLCSKKPYFNGIHKGGNGTEQGALNSLHDSFNSAQGFSSSTRLLRERRRLAKILLLVACCFCCCWLPFFVVSLLRDLRSGPEEKEPTLEDSLLPIFLLLGHLNSALNPLLYFLLSKNFRRSVLLVVRNPFKNRSSGGRAKSSQTPSNHSQNHVQGFKLRVHFQSKREIPIEGSN